VTNPSQFTQGRQVSSPAAADMLTTAITAHGGAERWQQVAVIEAALSSYGLAFSMKRQGSALKNLRISVYPHQQRVTLGGFAKPEWCGIWTPQQVLLQDGDGKLVAQRDNPYAAFFTLKKRLAWDKLDILYFAGKALWNYLCFPFYLANEGVTLTGIDAGGESGSRMLRAEFKPAVPSHSVLETFHIDDAGLLLRHDYTATVIGSWATAANRCLNWERVDGLRFYTRRRVTPRFGDQLVLPAPMLVWIELTDIRVINKPEEHAAR